MMFIPIYFVALLWNSIGKTLSETDAQAGPLILTPYIEKGETEKAKNLSIVDPSHFADIDSHAAYFTVNKTNKWHMFFWYSYFPAQGLDLQSTPLIIWLQGGPGCSSLVGLFEEIGPLEIKNGSERMPVTWGSNYSLLFIDNPVGTAFSFTEDPEKYVTNEDTVGECLLSFLQQFLQVFPELKEAPLFIAGESYAGKYIPAFAHYIHHHKNDSIPINLKGLAIGNGWIDPPTLMHYSEWALQVGFVDPEQAEKIHEIEEEARKYWNEQNKTAFAEKAKDAYYLLLKYAPVYIYNYVENSPKSYEYAEFLNKPEIQDLLHAKRTYFQNCYFEIYHNFRYDIYDTVQPWLEELLEYYGVMCYSGQLDLRVAYALSVRTYRSLQWSGQQAYLNASRIPVFDETEAHKVNFFVKESGNFMEVMIRNAGHSAPSDQPRAAKQMMDAFIQKFK